MLISITHRIFMHFPLRVDYIVSIWFVLNPVAIVTAIITTTSTAPDALGVIHKHWATIAAHLTS
jgi:hypothetical protein